MSPIWVSREGWSRLDGAALGGQWCDRRWMNTPGPIYTGNSDFALLGPTICPTFVALDDEKIDVVWRQPMTMGELGEVLRAADSDPFDGYATNGNNYWTTTAVRDWWSRVSEIRRHIEDHLFDSSWWLHPSELPLIRSIGEAWLHFLNREAEVYLRRYCHFLDTGLWPRSGDVLPDL